MSRRQIIWTLVIVLLILLVIGVAVWAVYIVATVIAKIAAVVAAAIIGLVSTLIAAIVNHNFQLEQQRQHEEFMAKQKNYENLLATIGDFARRKPDGLKSEDALTSAHLASWAFGDLEVLACTNEFQKSRSTESLLKLLEAVRRSLGQPDIPKTWFDNNEYSSNVLFAPRKRIEIDDGLEQEAVNLQAESPPRQAIAVRAQENAELNEKSADYERESRFHPAQPSEMTPGQVEAQKTEEAQRGTIRSRLRKAILGRD